MEYSEALRMTDKLNLFKSVLFDTSILEEETEPPIINKTDLLKLVLIKSMDDLDKLVLDGKIVETDINNDSGEQLPIYIVYEYQTKRSVKPITTLPYIYEKDILWALKSKGSTILKINFELVNSKTETFAFALSSSYNNIPLKDRPTEEEFKNNVLKDLRNKKT